MDDATYRPCELEGQALCDAVAIAQGWITYADDHVGQFYWYTNPETAPHCFKIDKRHWNPAQDWDQAGRIIYEANIQLSPPTSPVHRNGGPNAGNGQSGMWSACTWHRGVSGRRAFGWHDTSPLIAAMRCFVELKLGRNYTPL